MYEAEIPYVNGMKDFLREGIKMCEMFEGRNFLNMESGNSKVGCMLAIEEGRTSYDINRNKFAPP